MTMNEEITKQVDDLAIRAQGLIVVDQATADKADLLIALGKDMIKKIKSHYREIKQAQDEAKRKILRLEELDLAKVEPIVNELDRSFSSWQTEERRKAREAEEKRLADERRRKELEEEAMRKAQEAERRAEEEKRRAADELRRKEAAAKNEAEARAAREEAVRRQAEADKKAREEQDRILATAAAEESKLGPAPAVVAAPPVMAHSYSRKVWKWRVNQPALVPRDLCKPDDSLVDKAVNRAKAEGKNPIQVNIPGIDVWEEIENVRRRT
jgi:hypothetical protein